MIFNEWVRVDHAPAPRESASRQPMRVIALALAAVWLVTAGNLPGARSEAAIAWELCGAIALLAAHLWFWLDALARTERSMASVRHFGPLRDPGQCIRKVAPGRERLSARSVSSATARWAGF